MELNKAEGKVEIFGAFGEDRRLVSSGPEDPGLPVATFISENREKQSDGDDQGNLLEEGLELPRLKLV